jgi:hypothetical protein
MATDATTITVAVIGMLGLTLSTLGVTIAASRGNRKRASQVEAATDNIQAQLSPENGYESIGQGVAAIEKQLVQIDGRLQEGDERFERIETLLDNRGHIIASLESKTAETLALVGDNQDLMKRYITAWTPLSARAVKEWGEDGTKKSKKNKRRKEPPL